tara:strand:- start:814 stop:1014 length:201 start_codon:yes stop_codon:yes gene_type:complete
VKKEIAKGSRKEGGRRLRPNKETRDPTAKPEYLKIPKRRRFAMIPPTSSLLADFSVFDLTITAEQR